MRLTSRPIQVTDMLLAILFCCTKEELEESSDDEAMKLAEEEVGSYAQREAEQRKLKIKAKILAVGRMQRVFQLLRYVLLFLCI